MAEIKTSEVIAEILKSMPSKALPADTACVEITAQLLAEFRQAPSEMSPARLAQMRHFLAALGMTPASRGKIEYARPKTASESEWDQLL